MKKKLFLAFVVATMLACLFVVGISAADIDYSDAPVKTKIQFKADEIIEFYDGFKCPAFYVFKDVSSIGSGNYSTKFEDYMDFTYINGKLGKTEAAGNLYTYADVKGFDIPTGITHVALYAGKDGTTLKWITFPDTISSLSNAIFQNATGLEECTLKFSENNTMRVFPSYMFFGCKNLKAFSMPDCFTSLYDVAHFSGCTKLSAVHLSESLVTWSSGGGGSRNATFDDCVNMYFVNETFTYDDIPEKPEVYYFPKNLSSITNNSVCRECKNLNNVLVFGTQLTTMPNQYFFQNGPANKIVFLGDMTTVSTQYWGQTTQIFFANPQDKSTDDVTYSGGRTVVFCNAEGNTTHLKEKTIETEATCTLAAGTHDLCFCGYAISSKIVEGSKPLGHDSEGAQLTIAYPVITDANGNELINYFANAVHSYVCQREGCGISVNSTVEGTALFTEKGYSKEEGGNSFTYGISLNKSAEKAYKNAGNTVSYGFIIGTVPENATGEIINADGTSALSNYIQVDFATTQYENFSIYNVRMLDLSEAQKSTKIYCCAYIINNGTVSYIGESITKTALSVSYNDVPVK